MNSAQLSFARRSQANYHRRAGSRERALRWMFLVPALAYMVLFFVYPAVKNLLMGFQEYSINSFITGAAPWVGLSNYRQIIEGNLFPTALVNTVLFTVGSISGQFLIGLLLALFFKRNFPLNGVLRALLLLPWLLPLIASAAIWKFIMDQDSGILNQFLQWAHIVDDPVPWLSSPSVALVSIIIVNIWLGIPFNATILYGGLQEIPSELYEAAALDGATGWTAFWNITWPRLRPVVSVVLVLGVIYTLKVLDIILGLTRGGPANSTQTLATYSYLESFDNYSFGMGAAVSNILMILSLVFAIIYLRANRRSLDD